MASKPKPAAQKRPDLSTLYESPRADFSPGSQEFRATLLRPDQKKASDKKLDVDGMAESIVWRQEPKDPVTTGEVSFRKSDLGEKVDIHDGHVLVLEVTHGGKWQEVWRMRLYNGEKSIQGTWDFELADDGILLQASTDSWHYAKKKKTKPKGWKCHQIVRDVAHRYRIPLGKISAGRHYITDLHGTMSPMQVIQKAYALERASTGRRFVISWRNGKLNILPLRRNPLLYELSTSIEDAAIAKAQRSSKFATAVTVRATIKKSGSRKRRKITYLYKNKKAILKEGYVHKNLDGGNVKDKGEAINKAKRYIAKHSVRKMTLKSIEHRGIAFIRRGDMIQVTLPDDGIKGSKGICFVSRGEWTLQGGEFTMSLDVSFDDPYYTPKQKRKTKDKKTRDSKKTTVSQGRRI